ncbi:hypothetical protein D322_3248 [Yersinia enterocolitica IP 10393]|nr:hypothetical protein D322_3248 [Yersinia enterocolitica IP 10393]
MPDESDILLERELLQEMPGSYGLAGGDFNNDYIRGNLC